MTSNDGYPVNNPTAADAGATRSDRPGRFFARLDAYLSTISDAAARRTFLDRQIDGWEWRYARFIESDGSSEPGSVAGDPPQAADFLLTITGLAARRNLGKENDHAHQK
jgi:hypothetical protein